MGEYELWHKELIKSKRKIKAFDKIKAVNEVGGLTDS